MDKLTDKDLLSIQEARNLTEKAYTASLELRSFTQKDVDRITESMVQAGYEASEKLAKMAVEDTGFGKWEDKVIKNQFASSQQINGNFSIMRIVRKNSQTAFKIPEPFRGECDGQVMAFVLSKSNFPFKVAIEIATFD